LPVCLNDATKIIQAIHVPGKEYVCLMHIHQEVSEEKIRATINEFVGKIEQMPPVKSAVKRVLRTREIYYIYSKTLHRYWRKVRHRRTYATTYSNTCCNFYR
jgi:tRNA U55 pseudouridine synthase TruB